MRCWWICFWKRNEQAPGRSSGYGCHRDTCTGTRKGAFITAITTLLPICRCYVFLRGASIVRAACGCPNIDASADSVEELEPWWRGILANAGRRWRLLLRGTAVSAGEN